MDIEIDFDVYKALTNLRPTQETSYNDVLRKLLNLEPKRTVVSSLPPSAHATHGDWISKSVRFPAGTEFRASYSGKMYYGKVESGALWVDGQRFDSPSAAAVAITGNSVNGWTFWECRMPGQSYWQMIKALRQRPRVVAPVVNSDQMARKHNKDFPAHSIMAEALLCLIYFKGGAKYEIHPIETYEPLANFFGLSQQQRTRSRSDGYPGKAWPNYVQWARQHLINHGLLDGSDHGIWRLNPEGVHQASKFASQYERLRNS